MQPMRSAGVPRDLGHAAMHIRSSSATVVRRRRGVSDRMLGTRAGLAHVVHGEGRHLSLGGHRTGCDGDVRTTTSKSAVDGSASRDSEPLRLDLGLAHPQSRMMSVRSMMMRKTRRCAPKMRASPTARRRQAWSTKWCGRRRRRVGVGCVRGSAPGGLGGRSSDSPVACPDVRGGGSVDHPPALSLLASPCFGASERTRPRRSVRGSLGIPPSRGAQRWDLDEHQLFGRKACATHHHRRRLACRNPGHALHSIIDVVRAEPTRTAPLVQARASRRVSRRLTVCRGCMCLSACIHRGRGRVQVSNARALAQSACTECLRPVHAHVGPLAVLTLGLIPLTWPRPARAPPGVGPGRPSQLGPRRWHVAR